MLNEDGGATITAASALYTTTLRHMPGVWRFLYSYWSRLPGMESFRISLMTRRFRETEKTLLRLDPTTILTTHPLATAIASRMKSRGVLRARLVAAFGDWHFQPFWCFSAVDHYLVSAQAQRAGLIGMGVDPSVVTVSGMLVAPEYRACVPVAQARAYLELPQDRPVVLALGGGRGWGLEIVVSALARLRTRICAVVLCGSEQRRASLERMLSRLGNCGADIRLLPFGPDPVLYFHAADLIVNKPGGISTAQAFACGTPVLAVSPMPGHEEANLAELILGAVVLVPRAGEDLSTAIDRLLHDSDALQQTAAKARKLGALDTEGIALALLTAPAKIESPTQKR